MSCMAKKSSCEEAELLENWITFVWHVYSSPWSDQPSLHLDNSHLKKCFQHYPTIMYSLNQISNSYQGDVAQIQQQILQGRLYSLKRVLHAYSMSKQFLIVLGFKDAHSSNYTVLQEESCLHQRVLFSKYGSLSWKNIALCLRSNDVQLWRTHFTCLHIPCVLHSRKESVKRALHVQEGSFLT